jgi:drug/metabolite transporter (DMT)-like permease
MLGREGDAVRPCWRVHMALVFVQITFGAFHVLAKYTIESVPPLAVAAMRVAVSAPLLLLLARSIDRTWPSRRDHVQLALLGFLGVFSNQVLFILGLQHTTATNAAILMPSIPVFAAALALAMGIQKPSALGLAGIGLSTAGALVMLDIASFSSDGGALWGNGLIALNCLSYALYLVRQEPMLLRLRPLTVVAWAFVYGGIGTLLVSLPSLASLQPQEVPASTWWALLYIVTVPSGINYALNTWALKRSTPALVAAYTTLQPAAAALLAFLLLGEHLGAREAVGFALIVGGLFAVSGAGKGASRRAGEGGAGEEDPKQNAEASRRSRVASPR